MALLVLLTGFIPASSLQADPIAEHGQPKVLASKIDTITLHKDKLTTFSRTSPIPQLKCIGGNAMGLFKVETMRCRAQGQSYDENDTQWSCTAEMSPYFKLGSTQVLCEGYDHPDDPHILKGSCGVEYRLVLTEMGEMKFGRRREQSGARGSESSAGGGIIFVVLFIVVAFVIGKGIYMRWRENRGRDRGVVGGVRHGGGGDDNGDNNDDRPYPRPFNDGYGNEGEDLPPPYSETPDDNSGSQSGHAAGVLPFGYRTGAVAAAGLGAAGGISYANSRHNRAQELTGNGEGSSTSGSRIQNQDDIAREIRHRELLNAIAARPSNSYSSPSSSHTTESTGFGGTTRR